ncbi:hypothetical protein THRCLA_01056 [Thraustotheca clavata]|uniref:Beta-adaptin appendage C-terminal subdomain domain-containing protein n=1 Tax=Thraustotheca clavata TaxID=74557 RepID=A0A1W0AA63_9STRA|nr:hypothetical protein THRCLA_01056 [Thraustotheca clavata]
MLVNIVMPDNFPDIHLARKDLKMTTPSPMEGMEPMMEVEDAVARVLMKLSTNGMRGLAGLIACALAQVNDGSESREWAQSYYRFLLEDCLQMTEHKIEGLIPIVALERGRTMDSTTSPRSLEQTPMDSEPFVVLVEADISSEELITVLHFMLWKTVNAIGYDARTRAMFRFLTHEAHELPWSVITKEESAIGMALFLEVNELKSRKVESPRKWNDWKRNLKIGTAAVAGGTLLALTGGLVAPALAAGFTALGGVGAVVGTALASTGGLTAATVLFGTAGAGLAGYKTDRRTSGIKQFEFELLTAGSGMSVYICISGWLEDNVQDDFKRPWGTPREYLLAFYKQFNPEKIDSIDSMLQRFRGREDELFASLRRQYGLAPDEDPISVRLEDWEEGTTASPDQLRAWQWKQRMPYGDQFCLKWEKQVLKRYGTCIRNFTTKMLMGYARGEIVKYTVFAALFAAAALPTMVVNACSFIDSEWTMVMSRADMCGKLLAKALLQREQGLRPVNLIGYGMGARLIYSCLKNLAAENGLGLIENAVLLGCPIPVNEEEWGKVRRVVAGRLINGFSTNDWMLAVMYRYQGWALDSPGIGPVQVAGVENVDLSHIIAVHHEHAHKPSFLTEAILHDRPKEAKIVEIEPLASMVIEEDGEEYEIESEEVNRPSTASKKPRAKYHSMIQKAAKRTLMMVRAKNASQTIEKITVRFSPSQPTELPRTVQLPLLKQKILEHNNLDVSTRSAQLFRDVFQTSIELEAIIKDMFWYIIADEFQTGKHEKLKDDFYARIADNYTNLFIRLQMQPSTRDAGVFEKLPDVLSQLLFFALHEACPMSRYLLDQDVQRRLVERCYSWFVGFVPTQIRYDHWMPELSRHSQKKSASLQDFPALRNRMRRSERLEKIKVLEIQSSTPKNNNTEENTISTEPEGVHLPKVAQRIQSKERAVFSLSNSPLIGSFLARHGIDNNAKSLSVNLHLTNESGHLNQQEALQKKEGPVHRRKATVDALSYAELVAKFENYGKQLKASYIDEKTKANTSTLIEMNQYRQTQRNLNTQYAYIASQEKGIHELSNMLVCNGQIENTRPVRPTRPHPRTVAVAAPRKTLFFGNFLSNLIHSIVKRDNSTPNNENESLTPEDAVKNTNSDQVEVTTTICDGEKPIKKLKSPRRVQDKYAIEFPDETIEKHVKFADDIHDGNHADALPQIDIHDLTSVPKFKLKRQLTFQQRQRRQIRKHKKAIMATSHSILELVLHWLRTLLTLHTHEWMAYLLIVFGLIGECTTPGPRYNVAIGTLLLSVPVKKIELHLTTTGMVVAIVVDLFWLCRPDELSYNGTFPWQLTSFCRVWVALCMFLKIWLSLSVYWYIVPHHKATPSELPTKNFHLKWQIFVDRMSFFFPTTILPTTNQLSRAVLLRIVAILYIYGISSIVLFLLGIISCFSFTMYPQFQQTPLGIPLHYMILLKGAATTVTLLLFLSNLHTPYWRCLSLMWRLTSYQGPMIHWHGVGYGNDLNWIKTVTMSKIVDSCCGFYLLLVLYGAFHHGSSFYSGVTAVLLISTAITILLEFWVPLLSMVLYKFIVTMEQTHRDYDTYHLLPRNWAATDHASEEDEDNASSSSQDNSTSESSKSSSEDENEASSSSEDDEKHHRRRRRNTKHQNDAVVTPDVWLRYYDAYNRAYIRNSITGETFWDTSSTATPPVETIIMEDSPLSCTIFMTHEDFKYFWNHLEYVGLFRCRIHVMPTVEGLTEHLANCRFYVITDGMASETIRAVYFYAIHTETLAHFLGAFLLDCMNQELEAKFKCDQPDMVPIIVQCMQLKYILGDYDELN